MASAFPPGKVMVPVSVELKVRLTVPALAVQVGAAPPVQAFNAPE
jgi:hypothetical protein